MYGDSILSILDEPAPPIDPAYEAANLASWEAALADATRCGDTLRANWCKDAITRIRANRDFFPED